MASADVSRPTAATVPGRNPRRRTRQEIEGGSLRIGQPQRKRSKLANGSASFADTNGSADGDESPYMNGHATANGRYSDSPALSEIPLRSKRTGSSNRHVISRAGPLEILTKNERYHIGKLPSTPDQLLQSGEDFRASSLPSSTLTVALTKSRAIVWDIAGASTGNSARVFSLPYPSKANDPLPLGALVKNGLDTETGLVVIAPRSGKITFWENIENADALSLFQQRRNGTEGSVGSMLSGETVTDITPAEEAGFIISFSSGRIAQVLLRDSQSRPAISVAFLRSIKSNAGLFSGIWNALGSGGFLKNVASVKCRASRSRGLTDVIVVTEEAFIQYWHCTWAGQPTLEAEINAEEAVSAAAKAALERSLPSEVQAVKLLDFSLSSTPSRVQNALFRAWALIQISGASYTTYALMDLEVTESELPTIHHILPLQSYSPPLTSSSRWRPRLLATPNTSIAFVVFDKAVSMISLPRSVRSKANQDHQPFQDTAYLKDDQDVYVTGADTLAHGTRYATASLTIHVRQHGALRIVVNEYIERGDTSASGQLSVRSKIEQAVLYGTKPSNPLNLSKKPDSSVAKMDVEDAALEVSIGILSSQYPEALLESSSMDLDLQRRAKALEDLARHVKYAYPGLSRKTRWQLCWHAEKLAAARKMWADYDRAIEAGIPIWLDSQCQELGHWAKLFSETITWLSPDDRDVHDVQDEDLERVDQLRMYLRRDIWRLEIVFANLFDIIRMTLTKRCPRPKEESPQYYSLLNDAGDMVIGGLGAAFSFRAENAWLYDLDSEDIQNGVLQTNYEDLPEFWTSLFTTNLRLGSIVEDAQLAALRHVEHVGRGELEMSGVVKKLAEDSPTFIKMLSLIWQERHLWAKVQSKSHLNKLEHGDNIRHQTQAQRTEMLKRLSMLSQGETGIRLAEEFKDMEALSALITDESLALSEELSDLQVRPMNETAEEERARSLEHRRVRDTIGTLEDRIKANCNNFGYAWTKHWYSRFVNTASFNKLLDQTAGYRPSVTSFLRQEPGRRRLAWINEILNEKNYYAAGTALVAATTSEPGRWVKKATAGFSKLALLAAEEAEPGHAIFEKHGASYERARRLAHIQDELNEHVKPVTYNAVDANARTQLLMETYSHDNVVEADRPSLNRLLEGDFELLVQGQALDAEVLVDMLTLMDSRPSSSMRVNIFGREYYLALDAVCNGDDTLDAHRKEMLERLVWRRCYLADNWAEINNTAHKSDWEVEDELRCTILFRTFHEAFTNHLLANPNASPLPAYCMEAGTSTSDYLPRFSSTDLAEPIANDTATETKDLQNLVDTAKLEHWVTSTRELAWKAVQADRDIAENDKEVAVQNVRDQAKLEMLQVTGMAQLYQGSMIGERDFARRNARSIESGT